MVEAAAAPPRRAHSGECGGIVGTPPSLCTLPKFHAGRCEWRLTYEAGLPDGTGLVVTFDYLGDALLAVRFPDGSRTYGSMPRVEVPDGT